MSARSRVPSITDSVPAHQPSAMLLHFGMLLTGLGMTLVGPILPLFMARWGLNDSQGGLLLTAQFMGMSIGSIAIWRKLKRSLLAGVLTALAGFSGVALTARLHSGTAGAGFAAACFLLLLAGFGLGQLITSINLIAGERYESKRGSALSFVNFSWSVGAVLSPLMVAWLSPFVSVFALLATVSCGFLVLAVETKREVGVFGTGRVVVADKETRLHRRATPSGEGGFAAGIATRLWLYFGAVFFLYGGIEAAMSGWLATYTLRYGRHGLSISETTPFLFWVSLTAGRGLATLLLLRMTEGVLRLASLALAMMATGALIFAHSLLAISICSALIGLGIAPCFPATLSLMLQRRPRTGQAAVALALTGMGGAVLSWTMGKVSGSAGSLHLALVLPLIVCVALLSLCIPFKVAAES